MATESSVVTSPPRRRRVGRWVLAGVLVLVLLLVALVAFLPALASRFAPGVAEEQFAARFAGRIELERLALSWTQAQAVHGFALLDPDGAVVARGEATLPSLWHAVSALRGGADEPLQVTVRAEADLVTHADGTTNLQRALAPDEPAEERVDEPSEPGQPPQRSDLPEFETRITVERLTWRDEREATGEGVAAVAQRVVAAPIEIVARHSLAEPSPSGGLSLVADVTVLEPAPGTARVEAFAPSFDRGTLVATAEELPLAELDALLALGGKLEALVGARANVRVDAAFELPEALAGASAPAEALRRADGRVAFGLDGARARLSGAAALADGRLSLSEPIELRAPLDAAVLDALAPPALRAPGGALAGLELPADGQIVLRVGELTADAAELAAALPAGDTPLDPGALVAVLARSFALDAEVALPALRWTPPAAEGAPPSAPFATAPAALRLSRAIDGPLALAARAEVREPEPGALTIDGTIPFALDVEHLEPRLVASLDGLPLAQIDALAGQGGRLVALAGDRATASFELTARVPRSALDAPANGAPANGAGPVAALLAEPTLAVHVSTRVEAPRLRAGGVIAVEGGALRLAEPLALALELDPGLVDHFVTAEQRAAGSPLADLVVGAGARAEARLATLDVQLAPLVELLAGGPLPPAHVLLERLAPAVALAADGAASGLSWRGPDGATATASGLTFQVQAPAGEPIGVDLQAALAGTAPAGATAVPASAAGATPTLVPAGQQGGAPGVGADPAGGGLSRLHLALPRLAALAPVLAPDGGPAALPPIAVDGELVDLSTALLDRVLGTDGLFHDVLGPEVDARVEGRDLAPLAAAPTGRIDLALSSELAEAQASVELATGMVVPVADAPFDLRFALTPLSSPRLVGNLVPMVASVAPTSPAQRAAFVLRDFTLPLDGDLSKLSGQLGLDLGEVVPTLFPGAAKLLAGVLPELDATRLGPYTFGIERGVASYDDLTLSLGGRPYAFDGSVDLGTSVIAVRTEVPLSMLGGEVGDLIARAKGLVDPNLTVPVELSGTWKSPKVDVGEGTQQVLERAVQDALRNKLPGGLGDVLKGLGGGR